MSSAVRRSAALCCLSWLLVADPASLRHTAAVSFSSLQADIQARLQGGREFPDLSRLRQLVAGASDPTEPFRRDYYSPGHLTASAFVLSPSGQEVLMILHKKLGMWLQPGGHLEESDQDLVAAASRELSEETGVCAMDVLDPWLDLDVHAIPAHGLAPAHFHFDIRVLFQARSYELSVSSEVAQSKWFRLSDVVTAGEILESGCGTDDSVRRVAARLRNEQGTPRMVEYA